MGRLWRRAVGRCYRRFYGHWPFTARTVTTQVAGIWYELELSQLIDNFLYFEGCWEEEVWTCLARYVEPRMTVLDIGANIGAHTLGLAREVGEMGLVIGFEPMRWARKKLLRNLELNGFGNITIEALALSDEPGEKEVRFRSNWPLDCRHQPEASIVESIEFDTLDAYTSRKRLGVDLIKLDVDGYEERVIRGGLELLRRCRPIVLTEVDRKGIDGLVGLLEAEGYLPHQPGHGGQIADLRGHLEAMPRGHSSVNVAFLPRE